MFAACLTSALSACLIPIHSPIVNSRCFASERMSEASCPPAHFCSSNTLKHNTMQSQPASAPTPTSTTRSPNIIHEICDYLVRCILIPKNQDFYEDLARTQNYLASSQGSLGTNNHANVSFPAKQRIWARDRLHGQQQDSSGPSNQLIVEVICGTVQAALKEITKPANEKWCKAKVRLQLLDRVARRMKDEAISSEHRKCISSPRLIDLSAKWWKENGPGSTGEITWLTLQVEVKGRVFGKEVLADRKFLQFGRATGGKK